jgi:hypothetical protein
MSAVLRASASGRRLLFGLGLLVIAFGAYSNLRFALTTRPGSPAFEPRVTADSRTYIQHATEMAASDKPLYTRDSYHSLAMQVVTAVVFRAFGPYALAMKLLNFVLWLGVVALTGFAVARATGARWLGLVASLLVTGSMPLARYIAIVQYEIQIAFWFALLIWLAQRRPTAWSAVASGVLVGVITFYHVHYVLLVGALALLYRQQPAGERLRPFALSLVGFAAVALPGNVYYSIQHGQLFLFQDGFIPIERYLNPNSQGYFWPFPNRGEPSGLAFIVAMPGSYLSLLAHRWLYLTGFRFETQYIPPLMVSLIGGPYGMPLWSVVSVLVTLAAMAFALRRPRRPEIVLIAGFWGVLGLPHLVVNSGTRFLIPAIPGFVIVQVLGVRRMIAAWRCRSLRPRPPSSS